MKIFPLMASFLAGFVVASLIGLFFIVPHLQAAWTMNVQSDYCVPLKMIHEEILSTAQEEKGEKTVAQLRVLNQRFNYYRAEGPTPHDWWDEIIAAKQLATRPATHASRSTPGRCPECGAFVELAAVMDAYLRSSG